MDNRGLEKLDQWLLKYGNDDSILSASELDGFFAAIVSAPRQVAPAVWYSAIWADQPPQWPSDKDGERFMKLAVELYEYWQQNLDPLLPVRRDDAKVGRNDPCSCGSGKKYKQCCMR